MAKRKRKPAVKKSQRNWWGLVLALVIVGCLMVVAIQRNSGVGASTTVPDDGSVFDVSTLQSGASTFIGSIDSTKLEQFIGRDAVTAVADQTAAIAEIKKALVQPELILNSEMNSELPSTPHDVKPTSGWSKFWSGVTDWWSGLFHRTNQTISYIPAAMAASGACNGNETVCKQAANLGVYEEAIKKFKSLNAEAKEQKKEFDKVAQKLYEATADAVCGDAENVSEQAKCMVNYKGPDYLNRPFGFMRDGDYKFEDLGGMGRVVLGYRAVVCSETGGTKACSVTSKMPFDFTRPGWFGDLSKATQGKLKALGQEIKNVKAGLNEVFRKMTQINLPNAEAIAEAKLAKRACDLGIFAEGSTFSGRYIKIKNGKVYAAGPMNCPLQGATAEERAKYARAAAAFNDYAKSQLWGGKGGPDAWGAGILQGWGVYPAPGTTSRARYKSTVLTE